MDSTYEMVKELIDFNCKGVDTYNHNGSTWLIFTDNKKWVIELTKEKTLWYNYYFFTGEGSQQPTAFVDWAVDSAAILDKTSAVPAAILDKTSAVPAAILD